MATETLIAVLDARTAKLDAKLKATDDKLDKLTESTKKADNGFERLSKAGAKVGKKLVATKVAVLAVNAAISAMVLGAANNRKSLEILAKQAKTTTDDFQALSFATSQYGVNAEQVADASKDIADRLGEFSAAGTGTFQDYADVMKLSKEQAMLAAQEFEGLGSEEILGTMVSRMEDANVSGDKMTFVMESLANDASKLIPLFSNNSSELKELKARFTAVNESMEITAGQAEGLKEVSTSFTLMTSSLSNASTAISATLAPVMDDFFNDIINIVPQSTQTIIDFANSFLDAANISSIVAVNKQIQDSQGRLLEANQDLFELEEKRRRTSNRHDEQGIELRGINNRIDAEKMRTEELYTQLEVLELQNQKLSDAKSIEGGEIGGEVNTGLSGAGTGDQQQEIIDRFKSEGELLFEKLQQDLVIIGENNEVKLQLQDQYLMDSVALDLAADEERSKSKTKADKAKIKADKERQKQERSLESKNISSLMTITGALVGHDKKVGQALFLGSQAIAFSQAFVNTQAASVKALTIDPTGILSAKVKLSGYLSMGAIATTTLGSLSSGGGGGGFSGGNDQQQQQSFQPETSSLQITDSTDSGSTASTIRFATDSGDELMDTIAGLLNKGTEEGRYR